MSSLYIDYDKINMILTVKCFDEDFLTCMKKLEFSENFITSIDYKKNSEVHNHDVYGYILEERSVVGDDISVIDDLADFDLKNVLKKIILVRREEEREAVKSMLPNYYCLLIDNIDEEFKEAIIIYKNI